ncbi:MAG: alpha/beta hydrolase [Deltaproteobacteria bacterium]|nr:alpha/beta hydrolase [Deltaproteobacteria bacterium]
MPEPRHRIVDARGLAIHCLEWGEPTGTPLLLIHGFLDQAFSWSPFVDVLMRRANQPLWIIAPDGRGHGDSDWIGAGGYYHFPDYVFDLSCVVRALGLSQFNLVGHSMGGTISLLYGGAFPKQILRLVLIEGVGPVGMHFSDAPVRMEQWIGEVHHRGRDHFREYTSVAAGASQLQQTNPRLNEKFALALADAGMRQNEKGKWVWKFDPLHRTAAPQPFYTAQAIEFLRRIECAVLIVDGKESHQSKRTDKRQRYAAIANRRQTVIANAGHMVHQDNPVGLAEVVVPFLQL